MLRLRDRTGTNDKLFNHSFGFASNQPQVGQFTFWNTFGARTSHDDFGLTRFTTARTRRKAPPSPIKYSRYSAAPTSEWHFFPGLPRRSPETVMVWTPGTLATHNSLLKLPIGMRSNGVEHSTCTHQGWVDSRLLVVGSQTANLTPDPSFVHNLCCKCSNDSCKAIFDIYASRPFQRYKEHLRARCFDP